MFEVTYEGLPCTIRFTRRMNVSDFVEWSHGEREYLNAALLRSGGLLFKNLEMSTVQDFEACVQPLFGRPVSNFDGFSPRKKLSDKSYTSTEYDSRFFITLHNELSFSSAWPSKLFFGCLVPPEVGGETAILDGRAILDKLDQELLLELERRGVRYVRNMHGGRGVGPSWQQTYETEDRSVVEAFLRAGGMEFQWGPEGQLRVIQIRPATAHHPITKEKVWFNQVDQFHPSQFEDRIYKLLLLTHGSRDNLPMYGAFGDGTEIGAERIRSVHRVFEENMVLNKWERGDLLIIDNMLTCHGRMPYSGDRRIVVSMCQ